MQHIEKPLPVIKKFRMMTKYIWRHHRSGWKCAADALEENLCSPLGTLLIPNVDLLYIDEKAPPIPWVGFVHAVVESPVYYVNVYKQYWDLKRFLERRFILDKCLGLYTFSRHVRDYLKKYIDHVPVDYVYHPTENTNKMFSYKDFLANEEKKVLLIGHWMRNWQHFYDLDASFYQPWPSGKYIVLGADIDYGLIRDQFYLSPNPSVRPIKRLKNRQYDEILSRNIVFLPLYDVNACNTIIECIMRNTPVLTNRLPASEEYLGVEYPFFYDTMEEANSMVGDLDLIMEATNYLSKLDKSYLSTDYFIEEIKTSEIYQSL